MLVTIFTTHYSQSSPLIIVPELMTDVRALFRLRSKQTSRKPLKRARDCSETELGNLGKLYLATSFNLIPDRLFFISTVIVETLQVR